MGVREIKHTAKLSEWSERIRTCRSSGKSVKAWSEEKGITIKSYYRWERLYIAETSARIQLPAGQGEEAGVLVRIEPEKLPVTRASMQSRESDKPYCRLQINDDIHAVCISRGYSDILSPMYSMKHSVCIYMNVVERKPNFYGAESHGN